MTARESRVLCRQCRANDQLLDRVVADSLAARPVPVPETAASSWTRFSLVLKRACLEGSESNSMDSFVGIRVRVFRWGTPLLCRDVAGLLAQPYVQLCPHRRERRARLHLWSYFFQGMLFCKLAWPVFHAQVPHARSKQQQTVCSALSGGARRSVQRNCPVDITFRIDLEQALHTFAPLLWSTTRLTLRTLVACSPWQPCCFCPSCSRVW
jgi:hypothetical protein